MENQTEKYGLKTFLRNSEKEGTMKALGKDIVETFKLYNPTDREPTTIRQDIGGAIYTFGLLGLAGAIAIGPFVISRGINEARKAGQANVLWEEFRGNIPKYRVEISESYNKNGNKKRLIHLDALDEKTVPNRITGHDYDIDDHFERVFIMEKEFDACDSVRFTQKGVVWEPSPSSKGQGKKPFTEEQIAEAQSKLYNSLDIVRTGDNKTRHWVPGMGKKEKYGLIDRDKKIKKQQR